MWVSSRGGDGNITFGLTEVIPGRMSGSHEDPVGSNDATQGTGDGSMLRVALVVGTVLALMFVIATFADIEVLADLTEVGDTEEAITRVKDVNFPLVMVVWILTTILFVGAMVKVPALVEAWNGGE